MSKMIRIATIDDVETDEDLVKFLQYNRKMMLVFAREYASSAAELGAMLKVHDKRSGVRRRHKVVRPIALAAGVMILICRYMSLAAKRFQVEYAPEIEAAGRRSRTGNRTIRFGG
ncbi:MAG: hypothetical protein HOV87_12260 [Catenulispora sp.]|nr:hypothetical protein [Catenulispora sp.]NUT39979.1 hypothetical protein [Thermoactinospora sp.]